MCDTPVGGAVVIREISPGGLAPLPQLDHGIPRHEPGDTSPCLLHADHGIQIRNIVDIRIEHALQAKDAFVKFK
jgi:hypothetical protein